MWTAVVLFETLSPMRLFANESFRIVDYTETLMVMYAAERHCFARGRDREGTDW